MGAQHPRLEAILSLQRRGAARETYLTGDGWFVLDRARPRAEPRRCGTLADFAGRYIDQATSPQALVPPSLAEALSYADQAPTLALVVTELLPYLRKLANGEASSADGVTEPPAELIREIVSRASRLRLLFSGPMRGLGSAERLQEWLGIPCAIVQRAVIPLERVDPAARALAPPRVVVGGEVYSYRLARAREFDDVCKAFQRAAAASTKKALLHDKALQREAAWLLTDVRSLLSRYHPECRGRYVILHRDRYHEVHHSRGSWFLVRGPVESRLGSGSFFVGLHLRGASRRQLLSTAPRAARSPEAFWTRTGEPAGGGMCMGSKIQYQRLFSPDFSDVEATVQWLDAGTALATKRPALHRLLRESRLSRSADPFPPEALLMRYQRRRRRVE